MVVDVALAESGLSTVEHSGRQVEQGEPVPADAMPIVSSPEVGEIISLLVRQASSCVLSC